jgi:threonine/homoserine/homoserine lactone efflux protein
MAPFVGIFITSFLMALSGALMPGPLLTVTINESLRRGPWTGPLMIAGHGVLELAFIFVILKGLGELFKQNAVLSGIAFVGSVILLWMGYSMLKGIRSLTLAGTSEAVDGAPSGIVGNPIVAGVVVSLSNPYWTIWWLTIGLAYIVISAKLGIWGVVAFFTGHIAADLIWYTLVSTSVSFGRRFFTDSVYRGVVFACGLFLLIFSVYFFKSGFDYLLKI